MDKPAERIIFVPNLNVARNMKESEEGVVGGEEEEETEGIRRRGMRSQLLFRVWGQYLLNVWKVQWVSERELKGQGGGGRGDSVTKMRRRPG